MRNIILLCVQGMSSGVLIKRMQAAALKENYLCTIQALPITQAKIIASKVDIILSGPQVKYGLQEVQQLIPNKPIMFGFLIIMNPVMAIPFVASPVISLLLTVLVMKLSIVAPITGVHISTTLPTPIYLAFFMIADKMACKQELNE